MAAKWEAISSGFRRFNAKDILDLELTMLISNMWYIINLVNDEELKKLVTDWRDRITRVRSAIDPVLDGCKMDHMEMVKELRTIGEVISAVSTMNGRYRYVLSEIPNSLYGLSGALRNYYFGKAIDEEYHTRGVGHWLTAGFGNQFKEVRFLPSRSSVRWKVWYSPRPGSE